jgi:hypothetical protein
MSLFGLFGPPNVEKLKAKRDVKKLIKALNYEKNASVRQAAAEALGEINDAQQAVGPLINKLQSDNSLSVRLACYSSVERITGHPVGQEAQSLIEFTVKELERLYSLQREEAYGHWEQREEPYFSSDSRHSGSTVIDVFVEDGKEMVPHPDYNAIREIVELIPLSLRERVKPLISDEGLSNLWRKSILPTTV